MSKFKYFVLAPLLLGGCVVGPDYSGPPELGRSSPQSTFVRQAPSATSNEPAVAPWWTTLQDPVLDEFERRALFSNPSLEAAQARVRQARASVRQERANRFPTAGAQATTVIADLPGIDLQSNQGSGTPTPTPTLPPEQEEHTSLRFFNLGLNANWEIDLAGGQVRRIEAANALAAAAAYNAADAQVQLAAEVAQAADSELMPPAIPRNSRPGFRTDPAHHSD
jgi:outer membrane protein TolC